MLDIDLTALTSTEWASGNTHTLDAYVMFFARNINGASYRSNACAELILTYDYDDTAARQMKTLMFVSDSITGNIGTTQTTIDSTRDLSTILPEDNVTIIDNYLEFLFNMNETGTTDYDIYIQFDSDAEQLVSRYDAANNSDFFSILLWRTGLNSAASQVVKLRSTQTSGAPAHAGFIHKVTYSYDVQADNDIAIDTIVICHPISPAYGAGTTTVDRAIIDTEFVCADVSPTLVHAGFVGYTHQSADPGNLLFKAGSQSFRTFSVSPADLSGPVTFCQRLDSGGAQGVGLTLARGINTVRYETYYDNNPSVGGGFSGKTIITYTYTFKSNRRSSCVMIPIKLCDVSNTWTAGVRYSGGVGLHIDPPETVFSVCNAGYEMLENSSDPYTTSTIRLKKGDNLGFTAIQGLLTGTDTNAGVRIICNRLCDIIARYVDQPEDQYDIDVFTAKDGTLDTPNSRLTSVVCWVTWHDYRFEVAGNISNSAGGTVNLTLRDSLTGKTLLTATRTGNGAFSFTWFDGSREVYVDAYEDDTHLGRSAPGLAVEVT